MTAPLFPHQSPQINGTVILKSTQGIAVNCPWCQRIMRTSDGVLTLAEIAQKIHLPLKVCEKLVVKAMQENWLEVVQPSAENTTDPEAHHDFWFAVNQALNESLGNAGPRLLQEAALMTRLGNNHLTRQEVSNFLIALELVASDQERPKLTRHLDSLRAQYAA